jgi:hypothetical protein
MENRTADLLHDADRSGAGLLNILRDEHDGVSCQL